MSQIKDQRIPDFLISRSLSELRADFDRNSLEAWANAVVSSNEQELSKRNAHMLIDKMLIDQMLEAAPSVRSSIIRPPGNLMLTVFAWFLSKKTINRVFRQGVNDMRQEYFDALEAGDEREARAIVREYYARLIWGAFMHIGFGWIEKIVGKFKK
jgi:hypothetical protein